MLKSFDVFNEYLKLPDEKYYSYKDEDINGWFKIVDNKISAIYALDNNLYFKYDFLEKRISEEAKVNIIPLLNNEKKFQLFLDSSLVIEFKYKSEDEKLKTEPFDYIEDEDFDWGLFVSNIINNRERRKQVLSIWGV